MKKTSPFPSAIQPSGVQCTILSRRRALDAYASEDEETAVCNSVWNKLFRRDIVSDLRFEKGRESEDIVFTTKALLKAEKTAYIRQPLYYYTVDRGTSIMNAHIGRRRINDEIPFWKEQRELMASAGFKGSADLAYYNFCRHMLYYDLDFRRTPGMEEYAAELEQEMQRQKKDIRALYRNGFIKTGDKARMALFLHSPALYEKAAALYDRFVQLKTG